MASILADWCLVLVAAIRIMGDLEGPPRAPRRNPGCRARWAAERQRSLAASAFLAVNMSHELRTPLTAIMGYADLLLAPEMGMDAMGGASGRNICRRCGTAASIC